MINADDVQVYLRNHGQELPIERLRTHLIDITSSEAFLSPASEMGIAASLLDCYLREADGPEKGTVTFMEEVEHLEALPGVLFLGVLTHDWPGLADCTAGLVHERGWNIAFLKGVALRYGEQDLGIVIVGVKVADEVAKDALAAERAEFKVALRSIAAGSKAKALLLSRQTRKVEIYGQVIRHIELKYTGDDLDPIIGERGEALKFFASRSTAYVLERSMDDLSKQIVTNYRFVRSVRSSGGLVHVKAENLVTTRERLTGITVAGFDRDISLRIILEAIRKAFPEFQLRFNKEFRTRDGITLYRLEVCDEMGNPADSETIGRIEKTLKKAAVSKRVERARWIESIGGFEHYARAIIPFLKNEFEVSSRPQVFIAAGQANEYLQEFKVMMVLPNEAESVDPLPDFFNCIDGFKGLSIVSAHPPKIMGKCRIETIDVSADLDTFDEPEQIYSVLKQRLASVIGEFRDFDEGMRRADRVNLERVQELLPELQDSLLREVYYHLDDFYRVGAPVEELAAIIDLAVKALDRHRRLRGALVLHAESKMSLDEGDSLVTASLVAVAYASEARLSRIIFQKLAGLDCTVSKIRHGETTVLALKLMRDHRPLPARELAELAASLESICFSQAGKQ